MCALVLLNYHLVVLYVLGTSEGNLVQASAILEEQLKVSEPLEAHTCVPPFHPLFQLLKKCY